MIKSETYNCADNADEEELQLCVRCVRLVPEAVYYYPHCGAAVNAITPYLPFINIPFYASFCGDLWRIIKSPDTGSNRQITAFLVLLLCTPVIGLVFLAKLLGFFMFFWRLFAPVKNAMDV